MVDYYKKKPTKGVFLGKAKYNGAEYEVRNIGGEAYFIVYSKPAKRYLGTYRHIGGGMMLRKLGIEPNAGGNIFLPWQFKEKTGRKTFRGMNRQQIINAQKNN